MLGPQLYQPSQAPSPQHNSKEYIETNGMSHHQAQHLAALREAAWHEIQSRMTPFAGETIAGFNHRQQQAFDQAMAISQQQNPYQEAIERNLDKAHGINLQGIAAPYLQEAAKHPTEYIQNYLNDYRRQVVDPMRKESAEKFLEETMPSINGQMARQGAFYTGARQEAIERARTRLGKELGREEGRLMSHAHEVGMGHARGHREEARNIAGLASEIGAKQHQSHLQNATAQRDTALAGLQEQMARNTIGQDVGYREQELKQRKINAEREEQHRQQNEGLQRLQQAGGIMSGIPGPAVGYHHTNNAPPPATNWMAQAGAALPGMVAKKHGGSVRAKYAMGGPVGQNPQMFPAHSDSHLPAMNNPEVQGQQQIAQQLQNTHPNAEGTSLKMMSGAMLKSLNAGAPPMGAFGHGMEAYAGNRHNIQEQQYGHQAKAANVMDTINKSRIDQERLLLEHERDKGTRRLQDAHIAHLGAQTERQRAETGLLGGAGEEGADRPTKKMTAAREKTINEADANIDTMLAIIKLSRQTGKTLAKVGSSPLVGGVAEFPGLKQLGVGPYIASALPGAGTPEDISNASALSNEYLASLRDTGEKAGRSIPELRMRQEGKAGVGRTPEFNKYHTEKTEQGGLKGLQKELRKMEFAGAPPSMIADAKARIAEALEEEHGIAQTEPQGAPGGDEDAKIASLRAAIAAKKKELAHG